MRGRLRRVTPLVAALLMTWPHTAVARPVRPGTPNSAATATAPTSRPDPPAIPAHGSPRVKPWVPSTFDSLEDWAAEARAAFRSQTDDVIDSVTILPYNRVGAIAARWLADLGRAHAAEAKAVEVALDSLGFDTELTSDPELPAFILIVVRNPFRASAHTMGFMFWFRGDRIQEQGVELKGGREPRMRAWWNGNPNAPYEWVVIAKSRTRAGPTEFFLFRLTSDGGFWRVGQYPGNGPDFGDAYEIAFDDVNGDGVPEIVTWSEAPPDTLFEPCTSCPKRVIEEIFTERRAGFALEDSRLVQTPYAVFVLFIHLLAQHNSAAAARLLAEPARLPEALGLGWGTRRSPGTWKLELTEEEHWPTWLQFRFRGSRGTEHYLVRFTQKDGRWIIEDWKHAATASAAAGSRR